MYKKITFQQGGLLQFVCCVSILFFTAQNLIAQERNIEKLQVTYRSNFEDYLSFPSGCLRDMFTDSHGRLWFSKCITGNYTSSRLLSFDGYQFKDAKPVVKTNSYQLNLNYFGIANDKIYAYTTSKNSSYLHFYDTNRNVFQTYDTIPKTSNTSSVYDGFFEHKQQIFQKIEDGSIYTYVKDNNNVELRIINSSNEAQTLYPAVNLSPHLSKVFQQGANAYKEWLIGFDVDTDEIIMLNLITGRLEKIKTKLKKDPNIFTTRNTIYCYDNTLIFSFTEQNSINPHYNVVFNFKDHTPTELEFVEEQFKVQNKKSVFKDKAGNSISCEYRQDNDIKISLTDKAGQTYDISDIEKHLGSKFIKNITSENFFDHLYILTEESFSVIKLQDEKAIKAFETNDAIRGLKMIDNEQIIYLAETGLNKERVINLKNKIINNTPGICDFNRLKLVERKQKIWGISKGNLASYDLTSQTCKSYKTPQAAFAMTLDKAGRAIFVDEKGYFYSYNFETSLSRALTYKGKKLQVKGNYIDFLVDENNSLYIASPLGLYRYDLNEGSFKNFRTALPKFNYEFISIAQGSENELWLGSIDSGLIILNTTTGEHRQLNTDKGLCNNTVASITKDNEGYYWVGTYRGLAVVNADGKLLTNLYEADGLVNNECNRFSAALLDDGSIAIGSIAGISLIQPKLITSAFQKQEATKTYLTALSFYDVKEDKEMTYTSDFERIQQIRLPADNKNLTLEFATNNYLAPKRNTFAYKLKGLHKDWISLGTHNRLNLSTLDAGKYLLQIKGADSNGNWSKQPIELNIAVDAFFYNEIWFYALLIILLLSIGVLWILSLKKRVQKATYKIQQDKSKIEIQTKQLKRLDKAKNDFFTHITHEFRTPLTIIKGIGQVLKKRDENKSDKELEVLEQNADELMDLVNQILDLQKIEHAELKLNYSQSDLVLFLANIVESHTYLAQEKEITLNYKCDTEHLFMDFDAEKLRIVCSNLLSNAVKFTGKKGKIDLKLYKLKDDDEVEIIVQDNGIGFSKTDQAYAFELFYQSENPNFNHEKGSGIGLYYAKKLIETMRGSINLLSEEGEGTQIKIRMPITQNAEIQPLKPTPLVDFNSLESESNATKKSNKPTILVVEDNASVKNLLQLQLKDYNLDFAKDGQEGIDWAFAEMPDLIISDVMMPVKDGYELCDILKNDIKTSHIPIILLTAKASQQAKMDGLKSKADIYLNKPFDEEELLLNIHNLIESRKALQNYYKNSYNGSLKTSFPKEDQFIIKFKKIILENLQEKNFGIEMLCDKLKMSRTQLHHKSKALTGLSTSNFINHIKMNKAKELMESGECNATEAAYEVGISNISYFSTLFKKEFGESPRAFMSSID